MKKQLFFMIFLNLIVQLGITYYFMMNDTIKIDDKDKKNSGWIRLFLLFFMIFLIFIINIPMPIGIRFIIFSIISTVFGIILSNMKTVFGMEIIRAAIFSTFGIFVTLLLVGIIIVSFGITLGVNILLFLVSALLLLIISRIIFMFAGNYSSYVKTFAVIGLFIFSLFIIYDTNVILQKDYQGDFVTASLDYYLDILNIFTNITEFMGSD